MPGAGQVAGRPVYGPYNTAGVGVGAMPPVSMMQRHMRPPLAGTVFYPAPLGGSGPRGMRDSMQLGSWPNMDRGSQQQQQQPHQLVYGMGGTDAGRSYGAMPNIQQPQQHGPPYMMLQSVPQVCMVLLVFCQYQP